SKELTPLGRLRVARPGQHLTVVAYANGVLLAEAAADILAEEGIEVEVLDLRMLVPWDWSGVCRSVEKTGRCLVVHEASRTCGFGAEVMATLADLAFEQLDAPLRRVTALDGPTPAHPDLEAVFRPDTDKVVEAMRALAEY
ncbi:MAG: transketolase C-terminal domain-containing protein, partial [Myxococcota bacterium]